VAELRTNESDIKVVQVQRLLWDVFLILYLVHCTVRLIRCG